MHLTDIGLLVLVVLMVARAVMKWTVLHEAYIARRDRRRARNAHN